MLKAVNRMLSRRYSTLEHGGIQLAGTSLENCVCVIPFPPHSPPLFRKRNFVDAITNSQLNCELI